VDSLQKNAPSVDSIAGTATKRPLYLVVAHAKAANEQSGVQGKECEAHGVSGSITRQYIPHS